MIEAVNYEVTNYEATQLSIVEPEIGQDKASLISKWLSTMEVHSHALEALILELPQTAQNIENIAEETSHKFVNLSDFIAQQNRHVQQISALTDSLTVGNEQMTIEEFGNLFSSILNDSTAQILFVSKRAVSMVYMLDEAMSNLSAIEAFVGDINSITKKANLLALNASIESANAGVASKGFSIVADEMKQVSENISGLAQAINQRISTVHQTVKNGYGVLSDVATTDMSKTLEAQNKLTILLNGMIEQKNKLAIMLKNSENNSEKIAEEVSNINSSLQSQKNSSQYIDGSVRVLRYISKTIADFRNENDAILV